MSNSRDVTDYFLFYATNELLGLKKMKEAMWKVDESGRVPKGPPPMANSAFH
jgi:hypothetical protein